MKKLTKIFGILFCVSVIFTSCNKDKKDEKQNNDTKPKTEIEKDASTMADIICEMATTTTEAMKMAENFEAMGDNVDFQDEKILKMIEDFEAIETKLEELENDMETFSQEMTEKYEGTEDDNIKKAKEFVTAFTKYAEKCKDNIESIEGWGWDNMIQGLEEEMFSGYDEDGNPIIEENNMELSSMQSDAMEMSECYCMLIELGSKMNGEYDEETAMEFEAVSEYCEELENELEPIYSGNLEFMQLMEEFTKDCQ